MTELDINSNRAYVILRASDPETLDDYVNAATERGYWPIGAPMVDRWDTHSSAVSFYQAVTRKRTKRLTYRSVVRPNPPRHSYCAVHNTSPAEGEPCYACINKALKQTD